MIGRTIAHYEVTAHLGRGGMGDVYRARDAKLGRDVALKVLPDGFATDPERLSRFQREAKLLASLNHPHIATIHGIEGEGANRVLVLELVEGEDLSQRLASGAIPVKEALAIARQVADAIESAHDQGIVHRDLKPANVIVTPGGIVKVLDFGLAKAVETDPSNSNLSHSPTLLGSSPTMAGVILGTAAYMSPEQARGKRVDRRADIFAFGCLFFEMLTGRQAFFGETVSDTLAAVLRAEPEWTLLPKDTPHAIVRLLKRCLEKDPRQRLRDIGEARIVIEAVERGVDLDESAPATAVVPSPRRAWIPWVIAALAAVAAIAAVLLPRNPETTTVPESVELSMLLPTGSSLALRGQHPAPPAISPDGKRIVFGVSSQGGSTLYVRSLDAADAIALPGTEGAGYPFWSPDSRQIAFFTVGKLRRVDASGGPVTTVCDAALGKGGSWGADGTILFAPNYASGIFRVSSEGGTPVAVTVADSAKGEVSHRFPHLLPDGTHFLYVSRSVAARGSSQGDVGTKLKIGSLDGKTNREIMPVESNAIYADRNLLFIRNGFLVAQRFDPDTYEVSGEPAPVANPVRMVSGASRGVFDVSANNILIFQTGAAIVGNQLVWADLKGNEIGKLGDPAQHDDPIRISPDGSQVTCAIFDQRAGTPDIWIYDVKRNIRTRFTTDASADNNPVWSPDGSRIVFSSVRSGRVQLYTKHTGGSQPEALLYAGKGDNFANAWSPDGKYIVSAQLIQGGGWDLLAIPAAGGEPLNVVSVSTGFGVSFSPSGRWIAFDSGDGGARDTFVIPFRGSGRRWQVSSRGGFNPHWVGSHIYYFNEREMLRTEVAEHDSTITIGNEEKLFEISDLTDFDITRDGTRFLLAQTLDEANRTPLSVVLNWTQRLPAQK